VPLLLLDLDNTLIDRTGAFRRWAERYVTRLGGGEADVAWLITVDRDGYLPRAEVAEAMRTRFGLTAGSAAVVEDLRAGVLAEVRPEPGVADALRGAAAAGWVPVVLTNGTVRQQEAKLRRTGLDGLAAGWVISEAAGTRKPDPAIFRLAAARAGLPLEEGWMVGDHPAADVGGGHAVGLNTVWLRRGRQWPDLPYRPTWIADDCAAAIAGLTTAAG
jgi:putative hydrolase of the HAD superfamily